MSADPSNARPPESTAAAVDERRRLAVLRAYRVFGTGADPLLDHIARLAAEVCGACMSAINLIDAERYWRKATYGMPDDAAREGPRRDLLCDEAIASPDLTEIGDTSLDPRFAGNRFVLDHPELRFYAGMPLAAPTGEALGMLCVVDTRPRELDDFQRDALRRLAGLARSVIDGYRPHRALGALVEGAPSPILFFDASSWRWRHVNASGLRSLGLTIDEAAAADPARYSPAYAPQALAERLAPLLAGRVDRVELETGQRAADGRMRPVAVSFSVADGGDGPVVMAFVHDLSDRRRLDRERLERQRFFDMAAEMFLILHRDGRVLQANRHMADVLGYPPEALAAMEPMAPVHPADRERLQAAIARCIAGGEAIDIEVTCLHRDGGQRRVLLSGLSDGVDRIHVVGRDVTETRAAERRLRLLDKAFQASQNPIIVADLRPNPNGMVEYVNPAFERVTGYRSDEATGRNCNFLQRDDRAQPGIDEMRRAIAARRPCHVTLRNYRKDGTLFYNDLHLSPVAAEDDGVVTHYVGVQYDVTDSRNQQERISRLDRGRALVGAVGQAIVRVHTEQSLLQEVCDSAVGHGGFALVWTGLVDPQSGRLRPGAACGAGAGSVVATLVVSRDPLDAAGAGIAGEALRSTAPTVCNDIRSAAMAEHWREQALSGGIRSVAYLPIVRAGEVAGLVAFCAGRAGAFDDDELRLLRQIVGEVAFALGSIRQERRIEYLASHDPLTGLPDMEALEAELDGMRPPAATAHDGACTAVAMLDVERLKMLNDTFGKAAGDAVLCELAARLGRLDGTGLRLARRRSGPFVVAIDGLASVQAAERWVRTQLLGVLAAPFAIAGGAHFVSARCGLAVRPEHGDDAAALVAHAESALRRARQRTERVVVYSNDLSAHVAQALTTENELRRAVQRGEFVLHYQPKLDLAGGAVCGFEALLRWQHPQRGLVLPGAFVSILENTGLIAELGPWLVAQAVADAKRLNAGRARPLRIAVNVSQVEMRRADYVDGVAAQLAGIAPADCPLDVEMTESMLIDGADAAIGKMHALQALGVRIAIDDFGTGYSSLSYIARLPFDALKVDQSFVRGMDDSAQNLAIAASIVSLARSLGKTSIAEGVETAAQQQRLRELGCDQVQGWLHARAMPPDEARCWLARQEGHAFAADPPLRFTPAADR